jgi:Mrp family chromosome partitioning ATPase
MVVEWASTPREMVETAIKQVSVQKRVGGVVFNFVNQDRAQKYGSEYYYGKSYERYYSQ